MLQVSCLDWEVLKPLSQVSTPIEKSTDLGHAYSLHVLGNHTPMHIDDCQANLEPKLYLHCQIHSAEMEHG